jgi:hypothetical protein
MTNVPETVLIQLSSELRQFRSVILEMDMPTVDMDVALSKIFDAISEDGCESEMNWVANDMAQGEGLFENSEIDDDGRSRVYGSVLKLGEAVFQHLAQLGGYRDGWFPYQYKGLLDHDTVILAKVSGLAEPNPRDRNPQYLDPVL